LACKGYNPVQEALLAESIQAKLNTDQSACFNTILAAIAEDPETVYFYLQGPGRTGKIFLYTTIYYYFCRISKKVLCIALTGIAALLLPGGCILYSAFCIPILILDDSCSPIKKNSKLGEELKDIDLIIWDKVPIQYKFCFYIVYRLFTDLYSVNNNILFRGMPAILEGNFVQILPVVVKGIYTDTVTACLQ
jgi:hypothetical protein